MRSCKLCGKSWWFYSISGDGLCKGCEKAAKLSANLASSNIGQEEMSHSGQLEPATLSDYVGQDAIKHDLQSKIVLARQNQRPLPHILLCGPAEMGKATLAHAIAGEMGTSIRGIRADDIEGTKDLAAILTNLREGDFSLIEEIDSLSAPLLEEVISVVEDYTIHFIIGSGPSSQVFPLNLPKFSLIGRHNVKVLASGQTSSPMDDRVRLRAVQFNRNL